MSIFKKLFGSDSPPLASTPDATQFRATLEVHGWQVAGEERQGLHVPDWETWARRIERSPSTNGINSVDHLDAGNEALQQATGLNLGELVCRFLAKGTWSFRGFPAISEQDHEQRI